MLVSEFPPQDGEGKGGVDFIDLTTTPSVSPHLGGGIKTDSRLLPRTVRGSSQESLSFRFSRVGLFSGVEDL